MHDKLIVSLGFYILKKSTQIRPNALLYTIPNRFNRVLFKKMTVPQVHTKKIQHYM